MIALLFAGCAPPCTSFADMALTNPDGQASDEVVEEVRAAIDRFVSYSAYDGLCVDEIRLVEEIEDPETDPVGRYEGDLIRIEHPSNPFFLDTIVFHELCHATDYETGLFSDTRPGWFGEEEPHEGFAYLCDDGPRPAAWLEGVEAVCGEDLGGARQDWINEVVYGAVEYPHVSPSGVVDVTLERVPIRRFPETASWRPYGGGEAVYMEAPRVDHKGYVYADLVQVRPDGSLSRVYGPRLDAHGSTALFAADDGPLLVMAGEARAWRVDEAAGAFVEVPFPAFERVDGGVVVDDVAWFVGVVAEGPSVLSRVDLATGERSVVGWPEDLSGWSPGPYGEALGGWSLFHGATGREWLSYTPATNTWERASAPLDWGGGERLTLPDGPVLATWKLSGEDARFDGIAVLDPGTGAWSVPDAPCGEDAIGTANALVSIGGEPYLWEFSSGWTGSRVEGGDGHALTRIVLE